MFTVEVIVAHLAELLELDGELKPETCDRCAFVMALPLRVQLDYLQRAADEVRDR